jgi:flagellar operon protein
VEGFDVALARLERAHLDFSKHAQRRIEQRGLGLDPARLARLEQAVERAESKGSRDSLILLDELALVVSVQNRTVVTAIDQAHRKEHVFTNIDSVVIAE